jgi:cytoskeletal protein CcmA (bactofilin family)
MGLFGKKKQGGKASGGGPQTALIGPKLTVKGKVSGSGNLILMGKLEGEFDLGGELVIAPPAVVAGEIKSAILTVSGTVNGTLTARDRIRLEKSARVQGRVAAARLAVEEGAVFNGEIEMKPAPSGAGKTEAGRKPA